MRDKGKAAVDVATIGSGKEEQIREAAIDPPDKEYITTTKRTQAMTPMKAIRHKCLDCCCGSSMEVKLCPAQDCPLWAYRSGHNPARAGMCGKGFSIKKSGTNPFSEAKEADCGGAGEWGNTKQQRI